LITLSTQCSSAPTETRSEYKTKTQTIMLKIYIDLFKILWVSNLLLILQSFINTFIIKLLAMRNRPTVRKEVYYKRLLSWQK
jgi:hypothetical protein